MNIVSRQIIFGAVIAIIVFVFVLIGTLYVYPLFHYSDLWEQNVLDIPFIILVPSVSMVIGILFGFFSGHFWKKELQVVDDGLHQLEEGRPLDITSSSLPEIQTISNRMSKIQKQIIEQAKLSQRLATEAAQDQEKLMQEIIFQERNRLARELHDSVSQQLFAASMMMSAINETPASNDLEAKQLKIVEEMIHQSQLEMRALLLHLRPVALKGKTLQEGIEELLIELRQKVTMDIKWKTEEFPVEKGIEDHLFRILQESVSNTLRHSKASTLEVLLIKRDGFIILRVSDDGIGFDVDEQKAGSYGLQNMHERAVEIGGNLKIISLKQKGTRLEVKIPVVNEGEMDD
ncbi:sensor histidine kinase [Niallia sp. Krafla_26]|uniref:sensor histidine kinase n=1 Tax=Niallia sp. Krafla_26 TaxID=3064703 RepID=UPI003D185A6E